MAEKQMKRMNTPKISITPRNNNPRKEGNTNFRGNTTTVKFSKTKNKG